MTPDRGDVIIFRPRGGSGEFIKRVIAVPGDTLQIRDAVVKINGQTLVEDYLPEIWTKDPTWQGGAAAGPRGGSVFRRGRQPETVE